MSAPKKARGGQESELTRFKVMWRDTMSASSKEFWREQFYSETTQPKIRELIFKRLKINLEWNRQLNDFQDWDRRERKREMEAERMLADQQRFTEEFGDKWTLDQVREAVLKASYARAKAEGDFKLGLATVREDLRAKTMLLEARRVKQLEKRAAAYDRAQAALSEAKKSKGGLTPETLRKIEQELKLL